MTWLVFSYFIFLIGYRLAQFYAIIKHHNLYKPDHRQDWAIALVWVPLFFTVIGAPYDYYKQGAETPNIYFIVIGGIIFLSAIILRARSLADLSYGLFDLKDKAEADNNQLVPKGIYRKIRHPLYLANILLMISCATYLKSLLATNFAVIGIIGILLKIQFEEKSMERQFANYRQYKKQSNRLIPRIY